MRRRLAAGASTLLLTGMLAACSQGGNEVRVEVSEELTASAGDAGAGSDSFAFDAVPDVVATVASGLETPWGMDFLPDGRAVVTERDSKRVLLVTPPASGADGEGQVLEIGTVPQAEPRSEAGLLGVAVSPDFAEDGLVYFYVCTARDNRVVRARLGPEGLGPTDPILTGIPGGAIHDGGRLEFGPDGYLYVTTGEAGDEQLARDRRSLAGKILRITADGDPAPDNPFGTAVWSWGHRNVQGIAFDGDGQLWASEFGQDSADELNRIVAGDDYGWPEVEGSGGPARFAEPELTWSPDRASPSGLAFVGGYLWMAALQGERLWRIKVTDGQAGDPTAYFAGEVDAGGSSEYGRLRTVALAPDGRLWLTTSNTDGRGDAAEDDDRILIVEP